MTKISNWVLGMSCIGFGAFILLSLLSFSPEDPSFFVATSQAQIFNFAGIIGAYLSGSLLEMFGLFAFCIPLALAFLGWGCLKGGEISLGSILLVALFIILMAAFSYGFLGSYNWAWREQSLSGFFGIQIFNLMNQGLSFWGTQLVLSLALFILSYLFVNDQSFNFWKGSLSPAAQLPEESFVSESETKVPARKQRLLKKKKLKVVKAKRPKLQNTTGNWALPHIDFLVKSPPSKKTMSDLEVRKMTHLLTNKLKQFNVTGEVVGVKSGPAVSLFEFRPEVDVRLSRITDLADDLCLALSSESVRIIAPIPGRDVVGIETANAHREMVYYHDVIGQDEFWADPLFIPIGLGRKADGGPFVVDLRKMPHLMVAGSTGSGKSVFVVSLLMGLLYRHTPDQLKIILVDPKQVDLAVFDGVPHLLCPPIRETQSAVRALKWAIQEMDKRYRSMSEFGVRDLEGLNEALASLTEEELEKHKQTNLIYKDQAPLKSYYFEPLSYIVIIVEEFGDLMAVDKSGVESAVVRLAQMARACGIHLVLAMQSPRKDVVTGLIKTNIPGRISFKVASKTDSRIILDESGAERLLSRGDMLYLAPGVSKPIRAHAAYVSEDEISKVVNFLKEQGEPEYIPSLVDENGEIKDPESMGGGSEELDPLYDQILSFVSTQKSVSASMLQRKFRLGYPRAARLIEDFETAGVVGPSQGSKPRKVLVRSYE